MLNVLKALNIQFEHQKRFDWAIDKRYDFYIDKLSMIIEVHGRQHKNGGFSTYNKGKTLKEEIENDSIKKEIALRHVDQYIVIDSSFSELNFIKNSISLSDISKIHGFQNINWDSIEASSRSSISFDCLSLWNIGLKDIKAIAEKLNIPVEMVRRYIIKWSDLGKCDYKENLKTKRKIQQLDLQGNKIKIWNSISEASRYFTAKNRNTSLNKALYDGSRTALGFRWEYLND